MVCYKWRVREILVQYTRLFIHFYYLEPYKLKQSVDNSNFNEIPSRKKLVLSLWP